MIEKIHHIGLAVHSIDEALKPYRALGLSPEHTENVASQSVNVAFLRVGESNLELLEATAETSPIAKFVRVRGEGIHHICLQVSDIEATLAELKQRGMKLIDEQPRPGAGGGRIAFVHPSAMHGVLIELHEERPCRSKKG
jgi:methylmalonyl-CoA/ethylmalonyl-CoA epimerase